MRARIQPREAAAQRLDLEVLLRQELLVDRRDLQFAAGGRLDVLGDLDHLVRVEVQADHGVIALGSLGFLFDAQAVAFLVELRDAVALGIIHPIAEHRRLAIFLRGTHRLLEDRRESVAVEDVVPEHQAHAVVPDEFLADDESLRQSVRRRLLRIGEMHAIVGTVAQQAPEARQVLGRRDDQDVPDPGQHQHADRVVDHRFVVNRQQLLADPLRDGVETGAGSTGKDDAFHGIN